MVDANATRACVVCGALFPRNHKQILCSQKCRMIRRGKGAKTKRSDCPQCGCQFTGSLKRVYCSEVCKDRHRRRSHGKRVVLSDADRAERKKAYRARTANDPRVKELAAKRDKARQKRKRPTADADRVARHYRKHIALAAALNAKACKAIARQMQRPWAGMSDADAWRWRYNNDHAFRQKEIQRLKTAKLKRKKRQGHSLSKDEALAIYAERSSCLYCGRALGHSEKVLDHMDPLSKGGAHDASNLVVSCADCNTRKASKEFVKWLPLVADGRRKLVADWYKRKHGAQPEQASLLLLMAA